MNTLKQCYEALNYDRALELYKSLVDGFIDNFDSVGFWSDFWDREGVKNMIVYWGDFLDNRDYRKEELVDCIVKQRKVRIKYFKDNKIKLI